MKKFHVPVIPLFLSLYLTGCTAGISGQTQEPAAEKPQNVTVETTAADMEPGTDLMTCAIDFWPVTSPEAVFQLGYYPQFPHGIALPVLILIP